MGTMASGMAFGAGSEIAHQGVRAMMGGGSGHGSAPAQEQAQPQQPAGYDQYGGQQMLAQPQAQELNPCASINQQLLQCLQTNSNDIASCQFYMNSLQTCQNDNFGRVNYQ